jgi:hypothetical protein
MIHSWVEITGDEVAYRYADFNRLVGCQIAESLLSILFEQISHGHSNQGDA